MKLYHIFSYPKGLCKNNLSILFAAIALLALISGCSRDLSSSMYTSDTTLSFTMEGVIIAAREVKIKNNDKLADNTVGILGGGVLGAVAGANLGNGNSQAAGVVGGAIALGVVGALIQDKLSESKGFEYIVQIDTTKIKDSYFEGNAAMRNIVATAKVNGLVTIVQGADNILNIGQKIYIIFSDNRTRIIPLSIAQ